MMYCHWWVLAGLLQKWHAEKAPGVRRCGGTDSTGEEDSCTLLFVQLTIDWEKIRAKIALEEEKELGRTEN